MDIRPFLQDLYAPAVLVAATPAAEALVTAKNGISLVDLLRPYSSIYQLNVPVRVGEASVRVQDLRVRFYDVGSLYQPPPEPIEEHLQEVLKASAQRHARLDPSPDLLQRFMSDSPPDMRELTPWYDAYRSEFMRLLRFGDHETLDYPVACVFAIPADVVNPASHFDTLVGQLVLPPLMQQDVMYTLRDRDFPRHFVLLLDVAAGMNEKKAADNLVAIKRLYGDAHCSLLRINSGNGDRSHSGAPVDFFARYQHVCLPTGGSGEPLARPPPPPGGVGAFLTAQDLEGVAGFVRDFAGRTLLPKLEERISRLNAAITATRRGLRNRLNRFWKGSAEDRQTDRPYPWHSVEGMMRQLGDLAFLLRQYAFAESTYRLAAQDYLNDGNAKWYAGVEEMIGLCSVLGEPADPIAAVLLASDPMKYFMRAYENYSKPPAAAVAAAAAAQQQPNGGPLPPMSAATLAASRVGRMLATRVIMLCAAVQSAAGRHRAASEALMRAQSEEENARAGLLLEQSAYAMLYARPPLVRKFAFQMVLAGIRYICCGQKRIAIHAYRQVMSLYLGRRWKHIEEHLHAVLGAQCVEYGDKDRALWHFCALLDCAHRPPQQQAGNVAQFLNLLAGVRDQAAITHEGVSLVDSLPLPLVNRHDVRVLCSDTACYSGPSARAVPDATWQRMEACCTSGSNNWLTPEGGSVKQERDHEEYTMCVCGEEVGVQVEFRNPLAVKLKVANVQLICTFTPEAEAVKGQPVALPTTASAPAPSPALADGEHPLLPGSASSPVAPQPSSEYVHVHEAQLTLHPGEALVEVLRVMPRQPGWLRITGVTWTLNGVAHGRIAFDVKGRRRKRPKGDRPGQLKHYPPHRRLLFQVVPTMPRLELLADPLPPALYSGELCRVLMRIRNCGGQPLRSLALVVGHPEAVCPATDANKDRPLLDSLTDPREVVSMVKAPALQRQSLQLYKLWGGRELAPGEVLEWPLWLHPRGLGTLKLPMVWYGEPSAPRSGMRHRTLRMCGSVAVQPLLAARPTVWPSPTHLSHHLLRLGVDDSKEGERVLLQQVAAVTAPPPPQPAVGQGQGAQAGGQGGGVPFSAPVSGAVTPVPSTPTGPRPPPSGWRIALIGGPGGSAPGASPSPAAIAAQAEAADSLTRNLPLAVPLQPGESAALFLQLIAPPPRVAAAAAAAGGPGSASASAPTSVPSHTPASQPLHAAIGSAATATAGPGHGLVGVLSPPASGAATPGRLHDPAMAAMAVVQAAEAVRSLALGGGGAGPGPPTSTSGRLPTVDGSDSSLQRLNLYGPGVVAHFYRRTKRGMVATTSAAAAGAVTTPLGQRGPLLAGPGLQPQLGYAGAGPGLMPSPSFGSTSSYGTSASSGLPSGPGMPPPLGHSASLARGQSFSPATAAAAAAAAAGGPMQGMPGAPLPLGPGGMQGPPLARPSTAPGPLAPPAPGASGPGRPATPLPLADPPLDLLLLWNIPASSRTGPLQGQQRLGLCRPYDPQAARDLSGCLQAHTAPIRMLLTGPNGASSAASSAGSAGPTIRHDFRRSSLAVVPLRLMVRNNTALEARLQVEVGDGWQALDAPHSWQASTGGLGASTGPGLGPGPPSNPGSLHGSMASLGGTPNASALNMAGGMANPVSAGPTGGGGGGAGAGGGMGASGGLAITYQAGLPPCPEYAWVGATSVAVPKLEAGCEAEVALAVSVFRPGAYIITGHRCTAHFDAVGAMELQRGEPLCFRVEAAS
ncbi:hypothetical protein HYH03_012150 [Edaphochlamys debaryana]|uniref:Trafficking protein particle complex subunit 8 n=1 Tax=Edaphochlamys debaryana TaxID=47281 RepID=A0A835XSB5_9CHLO|nr:hypothetical protein HYH03_012150 [Edaphochlamys debaryana]|eukprot:KAG2489318.1 hypothetical protein HYH03_012150 [Edaphochlamys debaryana]